MAIVRSKPKSNFTVINNSIFADTNLDFEDVGLLVSLLSKPAHWRVSVEALQKSSKHGRDWFYKRISNLIDAGYIERKPVRENKGKLNGYDYVVYDEPYTPNPDTVAPFTCLPYTAPPDTANPTLVSTDYKKELNKQKNTDLSGKPDFECFWSEAKAAYTKCGNNIGSKQNAETQFKKAITTKSKAVEIVNRLHSQSANRFNLKRNGKFSESLPHLERWIKNKRWEDELEFIPDVPRAKKVVV